MDQQENGQSGYDDNRRKYILGGIAAAMIIIVTIAALLWIFHRDGNGDSSTDTREQTASEQLKDDAENTEKGPDAEQPNTTEKESADQDQSTEGQEDSMDTRIEEIVNSMTLEEKVCQLFMITPEALTGVGTVTQAGASPSILHI